MPHPRAFISFDFDNNKTEKLLFAGQIKNSRTPFNIQDWSSKEHLPQKEWKELIESKICRCDMVIVLVGRKTYAASGVVAEISFAYRNDIPVFGIYVGGADATTKIPEGLQYSRTTYWDWEEIASWVDRCIEEVEE
jgi:CTP synthase (UTP-ammonia lyase)